jgi:hypothetical protein
MDNTQEAPSQMVPGFKKLRGKLMMEKFTDVEGGK